MLLKQIFLIFIVIFNINSNTQFIYNESYNTKFSDTITKRVFSAKKKIFFFQDNLIKQNIKFIIPVKFWIITSKNESSKTSPAELKEFIQYLNYYYSINNTGIRFTLRPDFIYLKKEKLLNMQYYLQAPFQSLKKKSDACINVIIVGKLIKKKFLNSRKRKYAGTYNPFSHGIVISKNVSTSTLSHEIGHYLGLKHPHRGWKHNWFQEPVSRTRTMLLSKKKMCECKGDKLCDTPAEPNLTKYTNSKCYYTGWNVKDKYGEVYKPNTHNIMSYTNNRECRNFFTKGQIAIMHKTLSKNKYAKFWKTDIPENKKYFPDAFEPDNYRETAAELFFNTPQIHSFHSSYTGKFKSEIYDTEDWLFFELKTNKPRTIYLKFSEVNNSFPDIKVSIFKNTTLISQKIISSESLSEEIITKKVIPGKYIIKIQQINENKRKSFYKIILLK